MNKASGASRVPSLVGQTIDGRYRVDAVLARGGMGAVLRGTHLILGQPVAIKVMLDGTMRDPAMRDRFLREARILAQVRSPSIASIFDAGLLPDGTLYLVMELLEGDDLERVLSRGIMTVGQATKIVLEVCDGLAEAHEKGIVHRDLKPANVFVVKKPNGDTTAKIIDFGISKQLGDTSESTGLGNLVGSPSFMAPEQIQSSREVDRRADIWSLGVMLYRLVVGKLPFEGPNLAVILGRIRNASPDFPADLDPAFAAVVRRCLEKDRARRFANVAELRDALMPLSKSGSVAPIAAGKPPSPVDLETTVVRGKPASAADTVSGVVPIGDRPLGDDDETLSSNATRRAAAAAAADDEPLDGKKTVRIAPKNAFTDDSPISKKTVPMAGRPTNRASESVKPPPEAASSRPPPPVSRSARSPRRFEMKKVEDDDTAETLQMDKVSPAKLDRILDDVSRRSKKGLAQSGEAMHLPLSKPPLALYVGIGLFVVGAIFLFAYRRTVADPPAIRSEPTAAAIVPAVPSVPDPVPLLEMSTSSTSPAVPSAPEPKATLGPRASTNEAYLVLQSTPPTQVSVDGVPAGPTPRANVVVTPGAHTVIFGNPSDPTHKTVSVTLKTGEKKTVSVTMPPPPVPGKPAPTTKYGDLEPL